MVPNPLSSLFVIVLYDQMNMNTKIPTYQGWNNTNINVVVVEVVGIIVVVD